MQPLIFLYEEFLYSAWTVFHAPITAANSVAVSIPLLGFLVEAIPRRRVLVEAMPR